VKVKTAAADLNDNSEQSPRDKKCSGELETRELDEGMIPGACGYIPGVGVRTKAAEKTYSEGETY
jgi:hypothetical protein